MFDLFERGTLKMELEIMTKSYKALLGVAASAMVLATAAAGLAQEGPPRGPRAGAQGAGPDGAPRRDPAQRAQAIGTRLSLRPDQQAAFQTFIAATQPPQGPPEDMQNLTTPQRLDRQMAELQRRIAATRAFYNVLSPEQRQIFDRLPMAAGRGGRGGPDGRGLGRPGGRRGPGGPGGQGDYVPQPGTSF